MEWVGMNPSTLQRKHSKRMRAIPKERARGKEPPKVKAEAREGSDKVKKAAGLVEQFISWSDTDISLFSNMFGLIVKDYCSSKRFWRRRWLKLYRKHDVQNIRRCPKP